MINRFKLLAVPCVAILVALGSASHTNAAPPTTGARTNAVDKKAGAVTNAPIEIPVSKFVIPSSASEGRDPFFPSSTVFQAPKQSDVAAAPVSLVLQGVSVVGSKRFALINRRTFEVNEEGDVTTASGKIHVLCVRITEDSATVEVGGARQVLRMRPGR